MRAYLAGDLPDEPELTTGSGASAGGFAVSDSESPDTLATSKLALSALTALIKQGGGSIAASSVTPSENLVVWHDAIDLKLTRDPAHSQQQVAKVG